MRGTARRRDSVCPCTSACRSPWGTVPTCSVAHPGSDARGEPLGREKELAWEPCPDLKGPEAVMAWPGMWCACTGAGPEAPCSRVCEGASCTDRDGHAWLGRSSAGFKTCVARLVIRDSNEGKWHWYQSAGSELSPMSF